MGGVLIRDYHIGPELAVFLGYDRTTSFKEISPAFAKAIADHSAGKITEDQVWDVYRQVTGKTIPPHEGTLLGRFFHPTLDAPTVVILEELKRKGNRVVCGTNVIEEHYTIHCNLHQYDVFDKVYPSHLMGLCKPNPQFYLEICKEERQRTQDCFFTDDSKDNVEAAIAVGLHAYLYTDADSLRIALHKENLL